MTEEKYRECLKKLRNGDRGLPTADKTRAELEIELGTKLAAGLITSAEAEDDWQNWMNRNEWRER